MTWKRTAIRFFIRVQHLGHLAWRPLTLGVRAIVIDDAERVFLVRHSYVPGWHLPGGGVEVGETAVSALTRELQEEGNIRFEKATLHGVFFNGHYSRRDHVIVYTVRHFEQSAPRGPNWEIVETGFFPASSPPEGATRPTRDRLAEVAGERAVSALW